MDIARPASVLKKKKIRRAVVAAAAIIVVALVTVVLAQLKPAAPTVEARHDLARVGQARRDDSPDARPRHARPRRHPLDHFGNRRDGSTHRHTSERQGAHPRDRHPGAPRREVQQELVDAELQLRAAQADLISLKVRLNNELLQQQSDSGQHSRPVSPGENPGRSQRAAVEGRPAVEGDDPRLASECAGAREALCAREERLKIKAGLHLRAGERRRCARGAAPGAL